MGGVNVLLQIIGTILAVYGYVLIATAIISWIPDLSSTQLGQILDRLSDPYLRIFRRFIPPVQLGGIMLDIAFLVAIIVYFFVERGILSLLYTIAMRIVG
ncbi:YggT family protein [Alicyclobacillus curvatus]|jgi:YggT family protein|nr:YggT family protein [Alicyclobacillus curvatus]